MTTVALTIAGSDPSGGAGIQADLKTFHQHRVYGTSVITLLTVQNTRAVSRVEIMEPALVVEQLRAVLDDLPPAAAKTGALGNAALIEGLAELAGDFTFPLVVDPVMISKHGAPLIDPAASKSLLRLLRHATLVTPNIHEAAVLAEREVRTIEDARDAAEKIAMDTGARVLVKGGHLEGAPVDVLFDGVRHHELRADRVDTTQTHGTGCTLSAAITARLAKGDRLLEAVSGAKEWLSEALRTAPGLGEGVGPVNHFAPVKSRGA